MLRERVCELLGMEDVGNVADKTRPLKIAPVPSPDTNVSVIRKTIKGNQYKTISHFVL